MNILHEIAERAKERVAARKKETTFDRLADAARSIGADTGFPFEKALRSEGMSFICEVKRASPSKGVITENFPYVEIAREYEAAGADAVSVLTEPFYFKGTDNYLREIADAVNLPLLRKDFTVDGYMIYEAKILGASAVLLICGILSAGQLAEYIGIADSLGLSALVEAYNEDEVKTALNAGARIIGVNNRDLKTFEEVPPNTHFILTANSRHALLPTIRSRSTCFSVPFLNNSEISRILAAYGYTAPAEEILDFAGGSAGKAMLAMDSNYLELKEKITIYAQHALKGDASAAILYAQNIEKTINTAKFFLEGLALHLLKTDNAACSTHIQSIHFLMRAMLAKKFTAEQAIQNMALRLAQK